MKTLAAIAFALRFCNHSEKEDAELLPQIAPYGYGNIPMPIKTETRQVKRYGKGEQPFFSEVVETFADGSHFARVA